MSKKTIKIRIKSLNEFHHEILDAMKELDNGVKNIKIKSDPEDVVFFDSPMNFQKFFTPHKIEILAIIKHANPKSIYELANLAERKFPAVYKDVKSLESYGFLKLEENDDNRKSICPKLPFNYDEIVIEVPIRGYRVSLSAA